MNTPNQKRDQHKTQQERSTEIEATQTPHSGDSPLCVVLLSALVNEV